VSNLRYLIIGGGPAGLNALETIHQLDPTPATLTLVSDEPPYARMALPYVLTGQIPAEQAFTGDAAYFQSLGVTTVFGRRAVKLDLAAHRVSLDDGQVLPYDRLLLATGSKPTRPPISGLDLPGVTTLWTLDDSRYLLRMPGERPHVLFIGAGFIGIIVLSALFKRGWQLSVVELQDRLLPTMLDRSAGAIVERWLSRKGISTRTHIGVQSIIQRSSGRKQALLSNGEALEVDLAVVATGVQPNRQLAVQAGLACDRGILVNEFLRTSDPEVYAAGDVAQGPDLLGGAPASHAIQPTAVDHGRVAGANMAGRRTRYAGSLLINTLDIAGLQCAGYGRSNTAQGDMTTAIGDDGWSLRKYVWEGDRLVGVTLLGSPEEILFDADLGMLKGLVQSQVRLGAWRDYLAKNPWDIRRVFAASRTAGKLLPETLLGRPAQPRAYRFQGIQPQTAPGPAYQHFAAAQGQGPESFPSVIEMLEGSKSQ